ncbi:MAG: hypothetical protein KDA79_21930 [Planctomycetaceae bacterium]|nr:hypothetical protein [Planctomycetaceae bacterium]
MQAVVVALDRLPGRLLGCCGAEQARTPAFDRLAADGLLFPLCFADDLADSATDHAWWTGTRQLFRGGTSLEPKLRLIPALHSHDVALHLLSDPRSRVPLPDEALWNREPLQSSDPASPAAATSAELLAAQVNRAVSLLSSGSSAEARVSQLIWIQSAGCSESAAVAEPASQPDSADAADVEPGSAPGSDLNADRSVAQIQAEVESLDRALQPLVQWFTAIDPAEHEHPPLLLVTAAGGVRIPISIAGLDDTSARPLAADVVQTPLFLLVPGQWQNRRCLEFQQPMDLPPTLLEWFNVPFDSSRIEGRSLFEAARATELAAGEQPEPRQPRRIACTGRSDWRLAGLRTSRFYFTGSVSLPARKPADATAENDPENTISPEFGQFGEGQLFGKPEDQWDLHDIRREHLDLAETFAAALGEFCSRLQHELPAPDPGDILPVEVLNGDPQPAEPPPGE